MNKRNLIIAIVLLVIINAVSLTLLWKSRWSPQREVMESSRNTPEHYMKRRLGFSDEQLKTLHGLRQQHFEQIRPVENKLKQLRAGLFEAESDTLSAERFHSQLDEIGRLQMIVDSLTYSHFRQVRSICTPDQAREFNRILRDMTERRFGPGAGRGRAGAERPHKPR